MYRPGATDSDRSDGLAPPSGGRVVRGNPALATLGRARHVLLLQGPVGPFFDRLTRWLHGRGQLVSRVVFQGGDAQDCRTLIPIAFKDRPERWPAFLAELLGNQQPDCLVLFGQSRPYHQEAIAQARALGLPVVVLEEGYFRPGFLTMELGGVNGHSTSLQCFAWDSQAAAVTAQPCRWHFQKTVWHACRHYFHLWRESAHFPHYQHHRQVSPAFYAAYWLRSWAKKALVHARDLRLERRLIQSQQPYFLVVLQHEGDAQLVHHSAFAKNADFVNLVMQSFALHAPGQAQLIFKEHPHCRGGRGQRALVKELALQMKLQGRVSYLLEGHTPDLAEHACGVVLINSTVGLQALERGAPLIALGQAMYRRPGLTHSGSLDSFWTQAQAADPVASAAFLAQLKNLTQVGCSAYDLANHDLNWDLT